MKPQPDASKPDEFTSEAIGALKRRLSNVVLRALLTDAAVSDETGQTAAA